MGTREIYRKSLELAKKFRASITVAELKALISEHDAYKNAGPTYSEYLDYLQDELDPMNFRKPVVEKVCLQDILSYVHFDFNIRSNYYFPPPEIMKTNLTEKDSVQSAGSFLLYL